MLKKKKTIGWNWIFNIAVIVAFKKNQNSWWISTYSKLARKLKMHLKLASNKSLSKQNSTTHVVAWMRATKSTVLEAHRITIFTNIFNMLSQCQHTKFEIWDLNVYLTHCGWFQGEKSLKLTKKSITSYYCRLNRWIPQLLMYLPSPSKIKFHPPFGFVTTRFQSL